MTGDKEPTINPAIDVLIPTWVRLGINYKYASRPVYLDRLYHPNILPLISCFLSSISFDLYSVKRAYTHSNCMIKKDGFSTPIIEQHAAGADDGSYPWLYS